MINMLVVAGLQDRKNIPDRPSCFRLDSTKRREATVLMQDFHALKTGFAQQVDLKQQRTRRIFLRDVGEDAVAISFVLERFQIFTVTRPHERLDGRMRMLDQIGNPEGTAGFERAKDFGENSAPFRFRAQMMQHRRCHDHVKRRLDEVQLADVALPRGHLPGRRLAHARHGAIQHRTAQIHQRGVNFRARTGRGKFRQQLERIIPRAATDVQHRRRRRIQTRGGAGDQFQRQRRINRGRLAGLQIREPFDILVKAFPDLGDGLTRGKFMAESLLVAIRKAKIENQFIFNQRCCNSHGGKDALE
jgi:hypothetical protein